MKTRLIVTLGLGLGLGLAIGAAACSAANSCSTSDSAGSGGSGGSNCATGNVGVGGGASSSCAQLTALQACMDTFCKADGAGTPFCTCYLRGYDLSAAPDCTCVPFDSTAYCDQAIANGLDASSLDCSAASGSVASLCVNVQ